MKKTGHRQVSWLGYWLSVIMAFLAGAVMMLGVVIYSTFNQATTATSTANSGAQQILKVYQDVQKNYYKPVSQQKLVNGAINGMLSSLDDPFSEYLDASETSTLNNSLSGSFVGIGVQVQKASNGLKIISPIANSPAAKAGLKANDVITAVGGKETTKMSINAATQLIRGKANTTVDLTIERAGKTFSVKVKRASITQATATGTMASVNRHIGVITITTFGENTAKEVKAAVKSLRKQGATSFIIDLRNNPGGLMTAALDISSMFLKNDQIIMQVKPRDAAKVVYRAGKEYDHGFKVTEPIKVLVNSGSASAAEIFSAAMQQSRGAQLIGTKTYGKGTVQSVFDLGNNNEMKYTTAKWLTPNGTWINKKGLTPNIKADYPSYAQLPILSTKTTLKSGDVGDTIKVLQKILTALGYSVSDQRGVFGDSTATALKQFQAKHSLTETGTLNATTNEALYSELAALIIKHDQAMDQAVKLLTTK